VSFRANLGAAIGFCIRSRRARAISRAGSLLSGPELWLALRRSDSLACPGAPGPRHPPPGGGFGQPTRGWVDPITTLSARGHE